VGVVSKVLIDKSSNFFILKVKPAANLTSLQQVFVVENLNYNELEQLDKATHNMVERKGGNK
ncbi:MAG TPA: hypothetical protein VL943_13525, partial [Niabella sp.]|nr:hypothetical protein [Niabella sp.]